MKTLGNAILDAGEFTENEENLIKEADEKTSFHDISASSEDERKFLKEVAKLGFEDMQKVRNAIKEINQEVYEDREFRITEKLERRNKEPEELLRKLLDIEAGTKNRIIMDLMGFDEQEIIDAESEVLY